MAELFVARHAEWERLYNCTGIDVDTVPLEQRRQFVPEAWVSIGLCALYYLLYVPCMFSIWKHRRDTCYQLLFYIGCMDMSILWILGFFHGWLALEGAVFCSRPVLIYWVGIGCTSIWMAESSADLVLALNRCAEILSSRLAEALFGGHRTTIWLSFCSLYAMHWAMLEKPAVFSAIHFGWFFDPFIGYREDTKGDFRHALYPLHNGAVAVGSPTAYLLFAIALLIKSRSLGGELRVSKAQKMSFLQVFIISALNSTACSIYLVMAYIFYRPWLMTLAEFTWFHIHGFPPVIFLLLNKTIRNDCWIMVQQMFCRSRVNRRVHGVFAVKGVTVETPAITDQLASRVQKNDEEEK